MNIVLIGPPGSGKGTQAKKIEEAFGLAHLSTGQLIRKAIAEGDERAKKLQEEIEHGGFAPDEYVLAIVEEHLSEDGNLFDGFPRDLSQAEALDTIIPVDLVIELALPEDEIFRRLSERGRSDDTPETIKHRIEIYEDITEPLLEYYRPRGIVHSVDATGSIDEVFEQIKRIIETAKLQTP